MRGILQSLTVSLPILALVVTGPARAADPAQLQDLFEALQIEATIDVMHEEGVAYGHEIGQDMLPESDMGGWQQVVERLHDKTEMQASVENGFAKALDQHDLSDILAFLQSAQGQEIVGLEIAARRAFLDSAIEEAARDRLEQQRDEKAPVLKALDQLIRDSDLIERNVMGALNSNLAFYNGLVDGGALEMSQADIVADVWSQEDTVRDEARDWLNAFLLMAYQPLDDAELQAYIAFYQTPDGQVLNRAMFEAFDAMYEDLSYILGQALARHMQSEEL